MAKHAARCPKCGHRVDFDTAVGDHLVCANCHARLRVPGKAEAPSPTQAVTEAAAPPSPDDPLIGQSLGEFEIIEVLGRGGMGAVYKARQASLDRFVAVKVLPGAFSRDATFVERFGREARAAAAVRHPHIVDVHAVGEDRGFQYIAMEYVEGESLADVLRREGRIPFERAIAMMKQAAAGLAAAHEAGIIHRDIKPSNILLDSKGQVRVADFGLAKRPGTDASLTMTGVALGTPLYFPPEVARGQGADARSDLYSLGATFYHVVAGRPPFEGESVTELALKHAEAKVPPLAQLVPDAPASVCRIIHRLLRKAPSERYASAAEFLAALERAEARMSVSQAEVTQTAASMAHPSLVERQEARKRRQRHRLLIAGGCGLAALALVAVLVLVLGGNGQPTQAKGPAEAPARQPVPAPKAPSSPQPKVAQPKPPAWAGAWKEADTKAKALQDEQRFGEAIAVYEALAGRSDDPRLADRVEKAIAAVQKQASAAYQEAEGRARRLLTDKKFAEARAALRPIIERFGIPGQKERAETLLTKIDEAEKVERAVAAKAAEETTKRAEEERREAEKKRRQQAEARYAEALKPIEAMIGAWDFRGATAALAKLSFDEEDLAARLATRRDEVGRLAKLKGKVIQRIKTATPRLSKRALRIPGMGADVVNADAKGMMAKLPTGKTEAFAWKDLSARSVQELLRRAVRSTDAEGNLAAGILLLRLGDAKNADTYFARAKAGGTAIERYLDPLAEAAFARAKALLDAGRGAGTPRLQREKTLADAAKALADIETKYAKTPWFASHKAEAKAAKDEAAAETLYAQAAALFKKQQLFDLKPLVQKLKTDYPNTKPVTDAARKPTVAEMAGATAKLGKFLTVRKDGKGDFKSIQKAIDAAPPNSLIEIQDRGPYSQPVVVSKPGMTLRGKTRLWPVLATSRQAQDREVVVEVAAPGVTLEGLILLQLMPSGQTSCCIRINAKDCSLHEVILYRRSHKGEPVDWRTSAIRGNGPEGTGHVRMTDCVVFAPLALAPSSRLRGCLLLHMLRFIRGGGEVRQCTMFSGSLLTGHVDGPSLIVDSIIAEVSDYHGKNRIENCDVLRYSAKAKPGKGSFSADPQFRDPKNLDYRLKKTSPCRGKASDGGDIGVRYTPEMLEMLKLAFELRKKGIIKF